MRIERHRGVDSIDLGGGYMHKVELHSSWEHGGLRGLVRKMKEQLRVISRDEKSGVLHLCYDKKNRQGVAFVIETKGHIEVIELGSGYWEEGTAEEAFVKIIDPFETSDYYSVGDGHETLSHTEWAECLGEHFDLTGEAGTHIKVQCDELAPLEVFAWRRKKLHRSFAASMVDKFIDELKDADCMAESWWEEYGDCDGEGGPIDRNLDKVLVKQLETDLTNVLHSFMLKHTHIWQCDVVASKEFSVEELEEFAKLNYREEWDEPE